MKKMRLTTIMLLIFFALSIFLAAGCQQPAGSPPAEEGDEAEEPAPGEEEAAPSGPQRWTVASGWVTGVYYPLSGAMSNIAYEHMPNISLTAESSGASVANARLIGTGDAELAILQNDIAYYAKNGLYMFEGDPVENMVSIFMLYPEHIQIVASASSGIKTPADLAGKRVAVGPLGSGTEANAMQIAEVYGLTFDDFGTVERLTAGEAADFLKDDRIDAAFFTVGLGAAAIQDLALMKDIVIVEIDDEKAQELIDKYPYYTKEYIEEGVYKGVPKTQTVAVLAMLVGRSDLPEDLVYEFTKAVFDNIETIHEAHETGRHVTLDSALEGLPIDLHPGAERYFKEVGLLD